MLSPALWCPCIISIFNAGSKHLHWRSGRDAYSKIIPFQIDHTKKNVENPNISWSFAALIATWHARVCGTCRVGVWVTARTRSTLRKKTNSFTNSKATIQTIFSSLCEASLRLQRSEVQSSQWHTDRTMAIAGQWVSPLKARKLWSVDYQGPDSDTCWEWIVKVLWNM